MAWPFQSMADFERPEPFLFAPAFDRQPAIAESMIAIEKLSKRFGNVVALDRVNLSIERGELFFLLGPSGCGKTTLLRLIAGFYQPDEGRIIFDGEDVTHTPPHKRNTGMVFQNYALWPHLTIEKNVAFGLEERRLPKSEIETSVRDALKGVNLDQLAKRT